jgi:indolepyruvate ferredoxin oxidoreductase beta subunit
MEAVADQQQSVISSVLFGAIAASAVLPFSRATYEQAISDYGVAVKTNLAGFQVGFEQAMQRSPVAGLVPPSSGPTTDLGRALDERIKREFPAHLHGILQEGVKRMLDYQDDAYARLYLERMVAIRSLDESVVRLSNDFALTNAVARYLALWMSYEDTIRVADLKTRGQRFERFRSEVRAGADQIVYVTEFMHPRFEELCETLPAGMGQWLLNSGFARRVSAPLFRRGRHFHTARVGGFLMLYLLAGMRRWRRSTLRYRVEQRRIVDWLKRIESMASAPGGYHVAVEIAECQRLVKGYSDTHQRGLANFHTVIEAAERMQGRPDLADVIRLLRNAALADEQGVKLASVLSDLSLVRTAAA